LLGLGCPKQAFAKIATPREFFKEHDFCISTSLDGPAFIHNANRPFHKGGASHDVVVKNIKRCQDYLGIQKVSALMTTTRLSLKYPKEIVDEFISRGLGIYVC
jgi:sulfatase maturation enzyme AslB (radical SAM superfamily)